ncbi:MAG: efflux RND transporter periplasmic adaptor subunit [Proteobacteria bacterium]|nr:efflux RND transporter periplasmic adaptor subunit [Pseudomonadota bacterium]
MQNWLPQAFKERIALDERPSFSVWEIKPTWRLGLAIAGIVLALLLGWRFTVLFFGSGKPESPPAPVRIALAQTKSVEVLEHTIGTVLANATVQVTARVEGQILSAAFQEGQVVHKDDVLFVLDPKPFVAALDQTQGQLARDRALLVSAQRDAVRYAQLAKQGAVSASQRDQTKANAQALAAAVVADKGAVDLAKLNLQYATIRSPIDGKTGPILLQPGNLVKANDVNPLVVITQIQPVKVSFFLPQADLPRIQNQQRSGELKAAIEAHGAPQTRVLTPVDFVSNAVDAKTGTIELRATFDNADNRFVPGQLLDVSVGLERIADAIVVPHEAVNVGPNGNYVYVVTRDGTAKMVTVSVLYDSGATTAIEGEVRPNDKVITDGQLLVKPGKPVAIEGSRVRNNRPAQQ